MFFLRSRETYNALTKWLTDARTLASPNIVIILCGNKKDLDADREVTFLEASRFAQENGRLQYYFFWWGWGILCFINCLLRDTVKQINFCWQFDFANFTEGVTRKIKLLQNSVFYIDSNGKMVFRKIICPPNLEDFPFIKKSIRKINMFYNILWAGTYASDMARQLADHVLRKEK